jgi:uncharacterized protein (DUF924 family)
MTATPDDVLAFWFGPRPHATRGEWFRKDADFDAGIRARFGGAVEAALGGGFRDWTATPHGTLARVILLDQFTRNIYRDTPVAFAGDAQALTDASFAVDAGFDRELDRYERWFLYLPFEHAEDWGSQQRSLELFGRLAEETGDRSPLDWAEKHAEVIRRFGRYPHRNAILGRTSTPQELAFLAGPGSSF